VTRSTLEKTLSDFAQELATKARLKDTPLDQATDTFKALTAYRALELKGRKGREDDDDGDEPTMSDLQRQINGGDNGRRKAAIHRS
jgi:hypothetical protein